MEAFEVPNNIKLVNHTALAFTVEVDNQQIQAIREKFDPAFQRWQPHINFCFPFVDTPQFQNTYGILQERLKNFAPFEITFKAMDCFPHGTVFLVPETKENQLQEIYQIITNAIPALKANRDFHPHMTAGKFGKGEVVKRKGELEKDWKEWVVRCDGLCMIERGKDTPFKTAHKIHFQG